MKRINLKGPWIIILIACLLVAIILILGNQSFQAIEKTTFNQFIVGLSVLLILLGFGYALARSYRPSKVLEQGAKAPEEILKAAYEFQQSIIDGVAHPIMVIGADYQVKLMNRAAREFSGEDIDVSKPVFCYQVSHQHQAPCIGTDHPCPMEQVRQSGQPVTVIHQHYQANGEPRFVEVVASPLWGADGIFQGIIESVRDITERQSAEKMLTQQAQALSQADDELEQFAFKVVKSLQDFFGKLPPG